MRLNDAVVQILMEREQLPVKQFEEEIMAAIDKSPVVIIRGATGCGKTTQVPQYILDRFIKGGRASDCNIVVTQVTPRRPFTRLVYLRAYSLSSVLLIKQTLSSFKLTSLQFEV